MSNPGLTPIDPASNVGTVRYILGDTVSQPLTPAVTGQADYGYFPDAELSAFLVAGGQNPLMAVGFAYLALSARMAILEAAIKTDDLAHDDTKRSTDLRLLAESFFNRANNVEVFTMDNTGSSAVDIRDYLYPTGLINASDLMWAATISYVDAIRLI